MESAVKGTGGYFDKIAAAKLKEAGIEPAMPRQIDMPIIKAPAYGSAVSSWQHRPSIGPNRQFIEYDPNRSSLTSGSSEWVTDENTGVNHYYPPEDLAKNHPDLPNFYKGKNVVVHMPYVPPKHWTDSIPTWEGAKRVGEGVVNSAIGLGKIVGKALPKISATAEGAYAKETPIVTPSGLPLTDEQVGFLNVADRREWEQLLELFDDENKQELARQKDLAARQGR